MARPLCPVDHEGVKLDDASWSLLTPIGIQQDYDDAGNYAPLELRNCTCCHTTLARLVRRAA